MGKTQNLEYGTETSWWKMLSCSVFPPVRNARTLILEDSTEDSQTRESESPSETDPTVSPYCSANNQNSMQQIPT